MCDRTSVLKITCAAYLGSDATFILSLSLYIYIFPQASWNALASPPPALLAIVLDKTVKECNLQSTDIDNIAPALCSIYATDRWDSTKIT